MGRSMATMPPFLHLHPCRAFCILVILVISIDVIFVYRHSVMSWAYDIDVHCTLNVPCRYPDVVDLRVIVMTYNRAVSLHRLLMSLDDLELDGDTASMEIWIDREKEGKMDESVVDLAKAFSWSRGRTRVHVRDAHAGIYGQWIDTWRPPATNASSELCLILEDDLTVSPYAYRWLRAAHNQYGGRTDIAGYTLQSEGVNKAGGGGALKVPSTESAFLYLLVGSWGYAPHPARWRHFQDWYHTESRNKTFKPYVPGILMTKWYKALEALDLADTMWTMWNIYYNNKHTLYTLYSNIRASGGSKQRCLAVNRLEPGLHYEGKGKTKTPCLLRRWSSTFVQFPATPMRYNLLDTT